MDAPPPRAPVELDDDHPDFADPDELASRAAQLEREHRADVAVIGVLVERLLALTGGEAVEILDMNVREAPKVRAWRDPDRKSVLIAVE